MSNGRNPLSSERKEPQLSPMHLDDEPRVVPGQNFKSEVRSKPAPAKRPVVAKPKTGTLWAGLFLVTALVVTLGALGFLEFDRLESSQALLIQKLDDLSSQSDQIGEKLDESGGQIQQTQSSLSGRVAALEDQAQQLATLKKAQQSVDAKIASVEKTVAENSTTVAKGGANLEQLLTKLSAIENQQESSSKTLTATEQALAGVEEQVKRVQENLEKEALALTQAQDILREEVAERPQARMKKLQDQFATYMQSVDQFRQQTNASINDLSAQLRQVSQQQPSARSEEAGFSVDESDFGVQPIQ